MADHPEHDEADSDQTAPLHTGARFGQPEGAGQGLAADAQAGSEPVPEQRGADDTPVAAAATPLAGAMSGDGVQGPDRAGLAERARRTLQTPRGRTAMAGGAAAALLLLGAGLGFLGGLAAAGDRDGGRPPGMAPVDREGGQDGPGGFGDGRVEPGADDGGLDGSSDASRT